MSKNVYKNMMEQVLPDAVLIEETKNKMAANIAIPADNKIIKEKPVMRKFHLRTAVIIAVAITLLTTTAYAAWRLMNPSEVAELLDDSALSAAFESDSAININETKESGGYIFTLQSIVSGADISDYYQLHYGNEEVRKDRTYLTVAIQKADGTPMDFGFDAERFYISPYIRGIRPWHLNAHLLGTGATEVWADGVLYRLIECDDITIFADRGVYIGIHSGMLPNNQAILFNEETGELTANSDYDGACVIFELPFDKSLANPEKAQAIIDEYVPSEEEIAAAVTAETMENEDFAQGFIEWSEDSNERVIERFDFDYTAEEGLIKSEIMTIDEYNNS